METGREPKTSVIDTETGERERESYSSLWLSIRDDVCNIIQM